ncbi:MAG: M48 family metallopeptidase [Deltaproteobacteria bacterium]|nr:M48 family metallopeptidase [Deltaproteobacteria bacterium]
MNLLILFVSLQVIRQALALWLRKLNRKWYLNSEYQKEACRTLDISEADFSKTLAYTTDKESFDRLSSSFQLILLLFFLSFGGFGLVETWALHLATISGCGTIGTGLFFFAMLGLLSLLTSLPWSYYSVFFIEEKHGFNRQSRAGFFSDMIKSLLVSAVMGGILLSVLFWLMETFGPWWWLLAWGFVVLFQLLTVLIYPTVLAPLFNQFTPLEDGGLKDQIMQLARKVGFRASGIFVMNASIRSTHGNAFFTGLFSEKRIVLFDTLKESMKNHELLAVLAHELGHFKLNHVRQSLLHSSLILGGSFYLLSLCLPVESFYQAFALQGVSPWGALLLFFLWFGLLADFVISPLQSWVSRKNEFAADAFACQQIGNGRDLSDALKKLRQKNQAMPLSHPFYSAVYHSHPPLVERIKALMQHDSAMSSEVTSGQS